MFRTNIFDKTGDHEIVRRGGIFSVLEYARDISVSPDMASEAFFASQMNVRKKQLLAELNYDRGVITQAGAMQMMVGDLKAATNIKGAGDLVKKFVGSKVTRESTIKPHYTGSGILALEPTFKYIILENLSDWDNSLVIEDGMFLACEDTMDLKVTARSTISSAVLGKEGLFNTELRGSGFVALESSVPQDELMVIEIEDDVIKIDGDMAIAWSSSLSFTVERTTATLIGSMAAGEGLVNVYRGTGKVLVAPVADNRGIAVPQTKP